MRIQKGQPAKDFEVKDIFGNQFALSDFKDKKLLLAFFRYASCPLCNLRIHQLIQNYPTFETKGLHLLAFFQSPQESIRRYVGKQDAPFPIIADPDHLVYREYGVEASWAAFIRGSLRLITVTSAARKGFFPGKMEGTKSLIPADFLIGPDLIVEKVYYGKDIADHMPVQEIMDWL
jgi:peroxiredoxin